MSETFSPWEKFSKLQKPDFLGSKIWKMSETSKIGKNFENFWTKNWKILKKMWKKILKSFKNLWKKCEKKLKKKLGKILKKKF